MMTPEETRAAEQRAAEFERAHPWISLLLVRPIVWILLLPESLRHRRRMRMLRRMTSHIAAINKALAHDDEARRRSGHA